MAIRDLTYLILLGLLWGMSFLFVRVAAPEFGAVALIEMRVVIAAMVLTPFIIFRRQLPDIKRHWRPIFIMGVLHYALPFTLFAYSMLTLTGGYSAIINASSPLFATIVAWVWLGQRPEAGRVLGLLVGLLGVLLLVSEKLVSDGSTATAVAAAVVASFCYGAAAIFAKKQLAGVSPMAISAGSMIASSIVLLPLTYWFWPTVAPSSSAWSTVLVLGVVCTAIAFVLYFRLIANVGPTRAISVTFLIPLFAVAFGALFIDEAVSATMVGGGIIVLLGTAMAVGILDIKALYHRHRAAAVRIGACMLVVVGLNDTPPDVHAAEVGEWEADVPVYVSANSFYLESDNKSVTFSTLAASVGVEITSSTLPWSVTLFAEGHISRDARVDGTVIVGGQFSRTYQRWDMSTYLFASRYPRLSIEPAYAARLRRTIVNGHKVGIEFVDYFEQSDGAEMRLGYYGSFFDSLTVKLTAGSKLGSDWEPTATVSLSWQLR